MKKSVAKQALRHPVLWDKDCRNQRQYGLKNWPVAYLIGKDGKVFWEGNPAQIMERADRLREFRKLLEANLEITLGCPQAAAHSPGTNGTSKYGGRDGRCFRAFPSAST